MVQLPGNWKAQMFYQKGRRLRWKVHQKDGKFIEAQSLGISLSLHQTSPQLIWMIIWRNKAHRKVVGFCWIVTFDACLTIDSVEDKILMCSRC